MENKIGKRKKSMAKSAQRQFAAIKDTFVSVCATQNCPSISKTLILCYFTQFTCH